MKPNMGGMDRTIRILIALAIAVLYFTHVIGGTLAIVLGVIAIVFLITSLAARCPGYLPLKISTRKVQPGPAASPRT